MNAVTTNHRSSMFDNLKALLIFLVVLGHCLEEISVAGQYAVVRAVIYSFHMPVFIFISGYFSNDESPHYYGNTICSCLVPYLLFHTLYCYTFSSGLFVDILTPRYLFWYLFSLFLWRISLPVLRRVKFILPISIFLGLYCGILHPADRFLSVSRTIVYMPYFIFGWQAAHSDFLSKIRKIKPPVWAVICIVLLALVGFLQHMNAFPVKLYENTQCYHCSDVSTPFGILCRLFAYFVGFGVTVCLVGLIPDKRRIGTVLGETTITTYIGSAFARKALFQILGTGFITKLRVNIGLGIVTAAVFSAAIIAVCGNRAVYKLYQNGQLLLKRMIIRTNT